MKKAVIVGCGKHGRTIATALSAGVVEGVELVGVYNRTFEKAEVFAKEFSVFAAHSLEELLSLKPDYVIEAAGPKAAAEIAIPSLEAGADLLVLATSAFCDPVFQEKVRACAEKYDGHVYLAAGAVGGFDILRAAELAGDIETTFFIQKRAHKNSQENSREMDPLSGFEGSVETLLKIELTHLNVSASVAMATNGLRGTKAMVEIDETVKFMTVCKGDFGRTSIFTEMSPNRKLIGYSVIAILERLNKRITF